MAIRRRHRVGRHLVMDEESGFVHYDDKMVKRWDGAYVVAKSMEHRHPQDFVRVRKEGQVKTPIVPEPLLPTVDTTQQPFIGLTGIVTPVGAASHLYGWTGVDSIPQGIDYWIIEDDNPLLVFQVT